MSMPVSGRIEWLSDLIRLEIVLWDRLNARLKEEHGLSLAFFQALYFVSHSPDGSLRVGDLARALRITVGAASKLVDRVEAAGLICRQLDADDRRASRVALTDTGRRMLADASATCEAEMATVLNAALTLDEQQQMHTRIRRLLNAAEHGEAL
jgi:DNA-binding MarR family transcriptional regulator